MSALQVPQPIAAPINTVSIIINSVVFIAILIYHIHTTKKHNPTGLNVRKSPPSLPFSFILLFFAAWLMFNLIMQMIDPFDNISFCYYGLYSGPGVYGMFKLTLHLTLILRVHGAFKKSALEYSTLKLKLWASTLIIWQIFNVFLNILTGHTTFDANGYPKCILIIAPIFYASVILNDTTAAVINLYLFINPVIKLSKVCDLKDVTLKSIAIKQCVLSVIAILSTIFAMMGTGALYLDQLFLGGDLNISCLCIILS